jgi:hypothetical protein
MKYLLFVLCLVTFCFAGSKPMHIGKDTVYLNFPNGKITVVHDSIYSVETWKQRTDTTKTEYNDNLHGLIINGTDSAYYPPWRKHLQLDNSGIIQSK